MKIRTHKFAEAAYPLIEKMQSDPNEAKYRTLALNFPTMIMQSGLAQAIGFLMAKSKNNLEHQIFLSHIAKLLGNQSAEALHTEILKSDITQYQLLTRKALDATSWLKRYTQALLSKEGAK